MGFLLNLIPAPYRWAVYLAAVLAVFGAGVWSGHTLTANSYKADALAAEKAAADAYASKVLELNLVSNELEAAKNEKRIVYRTITEQVDRIIDRPVYRNVCLDDDGLRLVNAALSGMAPDPGKPDAAMPAPEPPARQDGR